MERKLHETDLNTFSCEAFQIFAEAPLLTAGNRDRFNTMTIGWGGLGTLWGMPVCTVYVRPERYTYEFMEEYDRYTVSAFSAEKRKELAICGSKSGRDVDKVKECGFTVKTAECGAPYFEEASLVLVCRKRFVQPMDPQLIPDDVEERWYPQKDYHTMYIGEIVEALIK